MRRGEEEEQEDEGDGAGAPRDGDCAGVESEGEGAGERRDGEPREGEPRDGDGERENFRDFRGEAELLDAVAKLGRLFCGSTVSQLWRRRSRASARSCDGVVVDDGVAKRWNSGSETLVATSRRVGDRLGDTCDLRRLIGLSSGERGEPPPQSTLACCTPPTPPVESW